MDQLKRLKAQMREHMAKEVTLHQRRVKRQQDLKKIEQKKSQSLVQLALKERFRQEAMMVLNNPEMKEQVEEQLLREKRGLADSPQRSDEDAPNLRTDSSVEDLTTKLTTIGKKSISNLRNSLTLRNDKKGLRFPKVSLFQFKGRSLQEIRAEEAKKKRVTYIFNEDGKRQKIEEERDIDEEDYETLAYELRFDSKSTLARFEKSPSFRQKRSRSDIQLKPLQLPHNRLRKSFEINQKKFYDHNKRYEIMVLPSQELRSISLVPNFDMIEEDVREAKTKKIPVQLRSNKGHQNQTMNRKKLSLYWQELNSQLIETAFRNKELSMSDVLGSRHYDKVTRTQGENIIKNRLKRLELEKKRAKEAGIEDFGSTNTDNQEEKKHYTDSLNKMLRQRMKLQQEQLKNKRLKEQKRRLTKSKIKLMENNAILFDSIEDLENPENYIQVQEALHSYLSRKINNSKRNEQIFWDDEKKRLKRMEEQYFRKQSLGRIDDHGKSIAKDIAKQKELLALEGKLSIDQIIKYVRERANQREALQNLADHRIIRQSIKEKIPGNDDENMLDRIKKSLPQELRTLNTMSQIARVSKVLANRVSQEQVTSDHIQSNKINDLATKLDMDNSTLENVKNIYLEELTQQEKFFDTSDSDEDLNEQLQCLQQDYLTVELPEGSPLRANKKEFENSAYRQVRDALRKSYMRKIEHIEKDILQSNIKNAVDHQLYSTNISDSLRIKNKAQVQELTKKYQKFVAKKNVLQQIVDVL